MQTPAPEPWTMTDGALADWPVFGLCSDVRPAIAAAAAAGQTAALVTLYAAEGPAPHGIGAQMLIGADRATGFLSGGCIEGDVAIHARAVLGDGAPRRLVYGRGGPPDIRLLCGARIEALVEAIPPDDPAARRLLALGRERTPALWLTDGALRACHAAGESPADLPPALRLAYERALTDPNPSAPAFEGEALYRRYDPRLRVVAVGADAGAEVEAAGSDVTGAAALVAVERR